MEKHIVSDMAKGVRIGIGFFLSLAVLGIGASFAAATWGALPQAGSGSTLSSSAWNDVVDHVNAIAGAVKVTSGNVGIGTDSPLAKFDVRGFMRVGHETNGSRISAHSGTIAGIWLRYTDSNMYLDSDNHISFRVNGSHLSPYAMTIANNGNVGIGLSGIATSKLEVNGAIARTGCPTGMASAGQYCVDTAQRASATWNVANDTCFNENKRLCSANEWASACRRNVFTRTANNWNWTANTYALEWGTGAFYYYAATVIGHADCNHTSWDYSNTAANYPYRCCADRVLGGN